MGYGETGTPDGSIPPNATIVFWTFRVMVGLGLLMLAIRFNNPRQPYRYRHAAGRGSPSRQHDAQRAGREPLTHKNNIVARDSSSIGQSVIYMVETDHVDDVANPT